MIDPKQLHQRIISGDSTAEAELALFLRNQNIEEFSKSLGPLAEDYLQDLCIEVMAAIRSRKVEHPQFLVTYCRNLANNVRRDGLKRVARLMREILPIEAGRHRRSNEDIEGDLIKAEEFQAVLKQIEQLDPVSREIIRRYYFEDQGAGKIQRDLELNYEQFRGAKQRAVKKLRDEYAAMNSSWRTISGRNPTGGLKAAA